STLAALAPRVSAELERRQREAALQHSVARLQRLTEYSRDVLFFYRVLPEPRFEYLNPAVEEMTGYPPEAFFADAGLILRLMGKGEAEPLFLAGQGGDGGDPILGRLTRADGAERWIECRYFAFRSSETGEISALCGSARDVTQRVE